MRIILKYIKYILGGCGLGTCVLEDEPVAVSCGHCRGIKMRFFLSRRGTAGFRRVNVATGVGVQVLLH